MPNNGTQIFGVASIGFGALLIWSAFTKKAVFGANGVIRQFIASGNVDSVSGKLGSLAGSAVNSVGTIGAGATGPGLGAANSTRLNAVPGVADLPPGSTVFT